MSSSVYAANSVNLSNVADGTKQKFLKFAQFNPQSQENSPTISHDAAMNVHVRFR